MAHTNRVLLGALALVLITCSALLGWLLWPNTGGEDYRIAFGTVVAPADCGRPEARDGLRVELLDGRVVSARLNGCGNLPGEVLAVEVPQPVPPGEVVVRLAGTGVPAATATAQRISAVLVSLAGVAGALLAWRLQRRPRP